MRFKNALKKKKTVNQAGIARITAVRCKNRENKSESQWKLISHIVRINFNLYCATYKFHFTRSESTIWRTYNSGGVENKPSWKLGTASLIQKIEQHIVTTTPWFYFWLFMAQWDLKPHNEICYWYSFFFNLQIGLPEIGVKFKTHWL